MGATLSNREKNARDDVMMVSHMNILLGDTYFQQLAVLGTAQQNNNKTKGRKAEIRGVFVFYNLKKS